jgi:hypothetical protein
VGPGKVQVLAQNLDQQTSRLDVELPSLSVHHERDVLGHGRASFPCARPDVPDAGEMGRRRDFECWHRSDAESSASSHAPALCAIHTWMTRRRITSGDLPTALSGHVAERGHASVHSHLH